MPPRIMILIASATLAGSLTLNGVATAAPAHAAPSPGLLLVLDARGGLGQAGPSEGAILAVSASGRVERALVTGLPFPFAEGIAPSPRGRYVAFGEEAQGLGVVNSDGSGHHRLLRPPRLSNLLGVEPVAWSPDRFTLAYALNVATDVAVNPQQDHGLGIWLTRYDIAQPRLLVSDRQLGVAAAASISQLSWSPDGRTLAVSTFLPVSGSGTKGPGNPTPVILGVDAATGASRLLVRGGREGVFAPGSGALAYVGNNGTTLRVADAGGRHTRVLVAVRGPISSPAWSPDGRSIAYITANTVLRTVDVVTGAASVVLTAGATGQRLLPANGQFVRLAWMSQRQ